MGVQVQWQATQVVQKNYTVFVQLLDPSGKLLAQIDQQPQQGDFPTSTWQPGDGIEDAYRFAQSTPPDAPWAQMIIGLYDQEQKRLPLQTDGAQPSDFFVLLQKDAAAP